MNKNHDRVLIFTRDIGLHVLSHLSSLRIDLAAVLQQRHSDSHFDSHFSAQTRAVSLYVSPAGFRILKSPGTNREVCSAVLQSSV